MQSLHAMSRLFRGLLIALVALAALSAGAQAQTPSYLVLAPDRGFLGNEEMRDVFDAFQAHEPSSALAFVTHEKTEDNLDTALGTLESTQNVVALPFFLSAHHTLYRKAEAVLVDRDVQMAAPFGQSYLAEEILFDRVEALSKRPGDEALVVVAYGAETAADAEGIRADLAPLVERAQQKYGLASQQVVVDYARSASEDASAAARRAITEQVQAAADAHDRVLVVPFNLGMRYTTMMASWMWTKRSLRGIDGMVADGAGVLPHDNALRWLRRTATAHQPLAQDDVGVILVPHGSDYNWNERMRESLAPLADTHTVAHAFSMVDPHVVERAVRDLEAQGVKAAVLVRIFSLEANFRSTAEYILGLAPTHEGGMGGHFPNRIESHLQFTTLGGLEDSPLFAQALLDRAQGLSTNPSQETVILLAHGTGSDARNDHWMENLATIADTMRARGGDAFRNIKMHTWREDWPELRKETIPAIRQLVKDASAGDGTAIVIPARTTAQGPAEAYLGDLDYRYGTGFAPHPLFVEWLRMQVETGIKQLNQRPAATPASLSTRP